MKLHSFIPAAALLASLAGVGALHSAAVTGSSLIKASGPAVYYLGADGKRYVFPNDKIYSSWYSDFGHVATVTDSALASYAIGGNVTYRPGTRLVKVQSDPKVYAVGAGGILRWVKTESAAKEIFGADWSKRVDDLSDSFFVNYKSGPDIAAANDFSPAAEQAAAATIDADKGLSAGSSQAPTNSNANVPAQTAGCQTACGIGSACVENACKAVPGPSAISAKLFVVDYLDTCFVGDPCAGGSCCSVGGVQFADNSAYKAVRPRDKYLYADKQQVCGRATLSSIDRSRLENEFFGFADAAGSSTSYRMSVGTSETRISGELTMSRLSGSCNWWLSPADLGDRLAGQVDSSTDAMFVASSRTFSFGSVPEPDVQTVDQSAGLFGAGYTSLVKEWEKDTSGAPDSSAFTKAFVDQMNSAVDLGVTDPAKSFVGNHCRDGKKDFDETGSDCGGSACGACAY